MVASADISLQACLESFAKIVDRQPKMVASADISLQACLESFAKIVDRQRKNGGFS